MAVAWDPQDQSKFWRWIIRSCRSATLAYTSLHEDLRPWALWLVRLGVVFVVVAMCFALGAPQYAWSSLVSLARSP